MAETAPFLPLRPEAGSIAPAIVAQAADWLTLLQSGSASAAHQQACAAWRAADARHELAWQRLAALDDQMQAGMCSARATGAPTARETLQAVAQRMNRRRLGRWALVVAGSGVIAWNARERTPWPVLAAQHRTTTGERRSLMLQDGTQLQIASASAVDVEFSATERRIVLHAGELLVQSGHGDHRPLRVLTREGSVTPVGTRFTVQRSAGPWGGAGRSRVAVLEGAVDVRAGSGSAVRVAAGEQSEFAASGATPTQAAPADADAWVDGMLVANRMPLADFVAALARWRPGVLRCAPDAAALRITGAFPLDDTDRALAMLVQILPVEVEYRTHWWATVRRTQAPPA